MNVKWIKSLFKGKQKRNRKPKPEVNPEHLVIGQLIQSQEIQNNYIVAMARLMFIKPEVLNREVKNVQANAEYLLKIIEDQKNTEEKHGDKHDDK